MIKFNNLVRLTLILFITITISWLVFSSDSVLAQTVTNSPPGSVDGVSQISNFIRSVIQVLATLAGLIAAGFFVVGGLNYITSSGNPVALERAKRTIVFAGLGLVITIGAFTLSNIISDLAGKALV